MLGDGRFQVGAGAEVDAGGVVLEKDRQLGTSHPMHGIELLGRAQRGHRAFEVEALAKTASHLIVLLHPAQGPISRGGGGVELDGASGWQTFNQFFAREVKSGRRPIAEPRDDRVVVSPADAVFMGQWPIDEDSNITVKGVNWAIAELLDGSPYKDAFEGGIYTHSFLYIDDYHRYHVPVAGTIREVRNIGGKVYMDVFREDDGTLNVVDGDTYQFNQERGLVVIDSPEVGLVAVLPIGMAYVSSVNLTTEVGAELRKGDQFGYFMFGGSDIVMVFQDRNLVLDAEVGRKYLQGQRLGKLR